MCKETFLRLPEEKRGRILDAAWEEFTSTSFSNVSINRIIRKASISRGSFYQYFEDKSDLFSYLIESVRAELAAGYRSMLADAGGDLFRSMLMGYDRFLTERKRGGLSVFDHCISIMRINPGIDLERMGRGKHPEKRETVAEFLDEVDLTPFRRQDTDFIAEVCWLAGICLLGALMDCLCNPGREAGCREELEEQLDILRRGSYTEAALRDVRTGRAERR